MRVDRLVVDHSAAGVGIVGAIAIVRGAPLAARRHEAGRAGPWWRTIGRWWWGSSSLTLNRGPFVVHAAPKLAEGQAILSRWRPHLAVVDMDHDESAALRARLGASHGLQ